VCSSDLGSSPGAWTASVPAVVRRRHGAGCLVGLFFGFSFGLLLVSGECCFACELIRRPFGVRLAGANFRFAADPLQRGLPFFDLFWHPFHVVFQLVKGALFELPRPAGLRMSGLSGLHVAFRVGGELDRIGATKTAALRILKGALLPGAGEAIGRWFTRVVVLAGELSSHFFYVALGFAPA